MNSLSDVYEKLKDVSTDYVEHEFAVDTLVLSEQGKFVVAPEQSYFLAQRATEYIAQQCHIPSNVFSQYSGPLKKQIVKESVPKLWKNPQGKLIAKISPKTQEVINFLLPSLLEISPSRVLELCVEATPKLLSPEDLVLREFFFSEEKGLFNVTFTSPQTERELKKGDLVSVGLNIRFENRNRFSLQIGTAIYRLICKNGLVVPICSQKQELKLGRLKRGHKETQEIFEEKIKDAARECWSEWELKFQALSEYQKQEVNLRETVELIAKERRYSKRLMDQILNALEEDEGEPLPNSGNGTMFHVLNAISRVGTRNFSEQETRYSQELRRLSGMLLREKYHRCERCGCILSNLN